MKEKGIDSMQGVVLQYSPGIETKVQLTLVMLAAENEP